MLDETNLIGKIITFAILGLLGWMAITTQQMSLSQVQQGEQIKAIQSTLSTQSMDRYSRSEAIADKSLMERRLIDLEKFEADVSERVRELERTIDKQ